VELKLEDEIAVVEIFADLDEACEEDVESYLDEALELRDYQLELLDAQKAAAMNPYPYKFQALIMCIPEFIDKYKSLNTSGHLEDVQVSLAGE
ncbi:hypothetical protein Tco_1075651, partial [Tanacetum coccineum]